MTILEPQLDWDEVDWLVFADRLNDADDPREEMVRLLHQPEYQRNWTPWQRDERVRQLLAGGMAPVVPTIREALVPSMQPLPRLLQAPSPKAGNHWAPLKAGHMDLYSRNRSVSG